MFHGHTASVNFVAGYHVSLQVATSHQDPVIHQGWSVRRTNGPVHLCRRWFQRQRWVEKAKWTWEHSINGDVIAPLRSPVTLGNPHHRNAHVYHLGKVGGQCCGNSLWPQTEEAKSWHISIGWMCLTHSNWLLSCLNWFPRTCFLMPQLCSARM